jgi:hypothetical protein
MADVKDALGAIERSVVEHWGMSALREFGDQLKTRPLSPPALRVFFASTAEFFKEIPGGILPLALRVSDERLESERFRAVACGASVLYSAVDEFGLHELEKGVQATHHEFFAEMVQGFGVSIDDLLDSRFILPEAESMAERTHLYYRFRPIAEALGFRLASELTSDIEFNLCLDGLQAFPVAYGLAGPRDPKLGFYLIHTVVEPMHGKTSRDAALACLARDPGAQFGVLKGAKAFMDGYGRLFKAMTVHCLADAPVETGDRAA